MKYYMRILFAGLIFGFFCCNVSAQITVKHSAYKTRLQTGFSSFKATNASGKIFDLGKIDGKHNTYDFTQFHYSENPKVVKYITPVGTPFKKSFGAATHCQKIKATDSTYDYVYFRLTKDGYYLLGAAGYNNIPAEIAAKLENYDEIYEWIENPPLPLMKFPLSLNSAWEYKSLPKASDNQGGTQQLQHHVKVVAAGTLKTPAGTKPCLVLKGERLVIIKTPKSTDTTGSMWYEFIAKDGSSARIYIDKSQANKRSPIIESASYTVKLRARNPK